MHAQATPHPALKTSGQPDGVLQVRQLSLGDYRNAPWREPWRPLAAILHGQPDPPKRDWPQVPGQFPSLDGGRAEVFLSSGPVRSIPHPRFVVRATPDILFAAYSGGGAQAIAAEAEDVYDDLLRLTEDAGYGHLLRVWHAIPRIHESEDGLERYRQFCLGRQKAFARLRPGPPSGFPAASVLGCQDGGLGLFALAAKSPGLTVENPNQISAYHYPPVHGPSSPSFSRALVARLAGQSLLFLSGTASITGHESRHPGQITAQVEQILDNLDALIAKANAMTGARFGLRAGEARLRAYVRAPNDFETVRAGVTARLGSGIEISYLEAEICRPELMVEMDGVISAPA